MVPCDFMKEKYFILIQTFTYICTLGFDWQIINTSGDSLHLSDPSTPNPLHAYPEEATKYDLN